MKIRICMGYACSNRYSKYILKRIKNDIKFYNFNNIDIIESSCMGMCKNGPNMEINGNLFTRLDPVKASNILENILKTKKTRTVSS